MAAKAERRRALEMHCEGSYTQADINQLMIIQGGRCAGCARRLRNYHVDHVMPLTKKGRNDISNLQLLCPPCNLRKSSKHPDEWAYETLRSKKTSRGWCHRMRSTRHDAECNVRQRQAGNLQGLRCYHLVASVADDREDAPVQRERDESF
jgi:hypothetical protein